MDKQRELYDQDAEIALIGAAFLDPEIFTDGVSPDDFGTHTYGRLWAACQKLARAGVRPDLVTLPVDAIPTGMNPIDFCNCCPSAVRAGEYARVVKRWAKRRKLISAADALARAAYLDDNENRAALLKEAQEYLVSQQDGCQRLWSLADMVADETLAPEDVVEGFIPGQSVVLFSGPGGDGKSYAMLDLAMCVSRGLPWLEMDTEQTPVMVVDLENRFIRMCGRARSAMKGHSLTIPPAVTMVFGMDARLDGDDVVLEITNLAESCGAGLVILDSLCDFWGEMDENSNSDMAKAAERLRSIAETIGGSVIGIHHTPKANAQTPRGATALRNGTDVNIIVSRDGNILRMKQDKNRSGPEMNVAAQMNWGPGMFNLSAMGVSVGSGKPPPDPDEAAILATLEDGEWHWSNDVVNASMETTGHKRRTLQIKMRAMADDMVVNVSGKRGRGTRYQVRRLENG